MQAATEKIRDVPAGAECHVAQFGYDEAQTQTRSTGRVRGEALRYMRHRKPRLQRGYEREQETGKQCKAVPNFAKTSGFRLHEPACFMLVGALPPIPAEHKNCVLERWINPSAARFFKSLVGRAAQRCSASFSRRSFASSCSLSNSRIRSILALAVSSSFISSRAFR